MGNAPHLRILGVDPGSVTTGVAVIELVRREATCLHLESLKLSGKAGFPQRLGEVFTRISGLIQTFEPTEFAIEQVFMFRSPESSLKLGQARGAAIAAAVVQGLPVAEYMPTEVKQAVVGTGRADKIQVQHMVKCLLKLTDDPPADGADAAAIALCHAFRRTSLMGACESGGLSEQQRENMRLLAQSRFRRRSR
ncbi:MAG: crossover junction endodeoxyribonuclease RuvC [Gammaproteobacteria bacterium]|nr:crossover junction endodeoxyribonuclease RuvC [Gammaproteobacteria bacterium]